MTTNPICPEHKTSMKHGEKDGQGYWKCPQDGCTIFISDELVHAVMQFFPLATGSAKDFLCNSDKFEKYDTNGSYLMRGYELESLLNDYKEKP